MKANELVRPVRVKRPVVPLGILLEVALETTG